MAPAPKFSAQEQEKMILDAAVESIENSSLMDFSMSAIAKAAGLSMGSVYKFVQCKEDVLIALANNMYQNKRQVFNQVLSLDITTPERIIALSLVDNSKTQTYSFDDQLESFVNTQAVIKRCSPRWVEHMANSSKACGAAFDQLLFKAAESNELTSGLASVEEINVATWSMAVGYFQTVQMYQTLHLDEEARQQIQKEPLAPDNIHIRALTRLINAYDFTKKIDEQDIIKICQLMKAKGLR